MNTNHSKKINMYKLLSIIATVIGIALLTFMIVVEDEPGALPLALIVFGTGWYFITRSRLSSQQAQS